MYEKEPYIRKPTGAGCSPLPKKMLSLWGSQSLEDIGRYPQIMLGLLVSPRAVLGEGPTQPGLSGWVGGASSAKKCLPLTGGLVSMVTD